MLRSLIEPLRNRMSISEEHDNLIETIENSDYDDYPYEHFYMRNPFSESFYQEILESLPPDDVTPSNQSLVSVSTRDSRHSHTRA